MTKTYSDYCCLISINAREPHALPPVWRESWIWVAVRLEDFFYNVPHLAPLCQMFLAEQVKRDDTRAYILKEYVVSDAIRKGFVHKLNLTLIPRDPAVLYPPFGKSYKTTLTISGALVVKDFINGVLEPFIFKIGPDNIEYLVKPNSVSEVGGRRNKQRF